MNVVLELSGALDAKPSVLVDGWRLRFEELTEREQGLLRSYREVLVRHGQRSYEEGAESNVETLRDEFAKAALAGLDIDETLKGMLPDKGYQNPTVVADAVANRAYLVADAMLRIRAGREGS